MPSLNTLSQNISIDDEQLNTTGLRSIVNNGHPAWGKDLLNLKNIKVYRHKIVLLT